MFRFSITTSTLIYNLRHHVISTRLEVKIDTFLFVSEVDESGFRVFLKFNANENLSSKVFFISQKRVEHFCFDLIQFNAVTRRLLKALLLLTLRCETYPQSTLPGQTAVCSLLPILRLKENLFKYERLCHLCRTGYFNHWNYLFKRSSF